MLRWLLSKNWLFYQVRQHGFKDETDIKSRPKSSGYTGLDEAPNRIQAPIWSSLTSWNLVTNMYLSTFTRNKAQVGAKTNSARLGCFFR
jgi:hypothetical protein